MKNKLLILVGVVILLLTFSSFFSNSSKLSVETNESQQQEDFLKIYDYTLKTIKMSNTMFYTVHNLLDEASRAQVYGFLKDNEKRQKELSVLFIEINSKIPQTLDEHREDISQSLHELATVCANRQMESKYLAEYINTGDLESYRKAKEEMEGTGKILSNAVSRLIFGVGEKLNTDTQSMENEYARINAEVEQEFKDRFSE